MEDGDELEFQHLRRFSYVVDESPTFVKAGYFVKVDLCRSTTIIETAARLTDADGKPLMLSLIDKPSETPGCDMCLQALKRVAHITPLAVARSTR